MFSNTRFSMAVHVLTVLAASPEDVVPSEDLARSVETNASFLRQLIGQLKAAGLVKTKLGKGGGAMLGRAPGEVTLLDVYKATESKPPISTHECGEGSACYVARGMNEVLGALNTKIETLVTDELARTKLSDVVERVGTA